MTGSKGAGGIVDESRHVVVLGRAIAAASIGLAVGGLASLVVLGRGDHIVEGYAAHLALPAIGFGALTWVAIRRQPDNRTVWVMGWVALATALGAAGWAAAILIGVAAGLDSSFAAWGRLSPSDVPPAAAVAWLLTFVGAVPGYYSVFTLGMLLGPEGRLVSSRWRGVVAGAVGTMVVLTAVLVVRWWPGASGGYASDPGAGTGVAVDLLFLLLTMLAALSIGSMVVRYRQSQGAGREQCRWIGLGTVALLGMFGVASVVELVPGLASSGWERAAYLAGLAALVACYGVAVTRYRLYDIDVVISRALSYGVLAVFIGAAYVAVVVAVGLLVDSAEGSLVPSVLAMAVIAISFDPVRRWAQRRADRFVYGDRATPYQVLADLISRLTGSEPAGRVLGRAVGLLADATGAEQATIWLADGERLTALAGWPGLPSARETTSVDDLGGVVHPVLQDGRVVGALQVIKPPGESITSAEDRLLRDLAGSTGLILGNQRLVAALSARAAELRASRRRLVDAEHAERRHLERDLRDGAQRRVEILAERVREVEPVVRGRGAAVAADLLVEVHSDLREVATQIGAFARGIYPPRLHAGGLAAALREQLAALPVTTDVDVEPVRRLPTDVESGLYFAALEAVANAVKHGAPTRVRVKVSAGEHDVVTSVRDDGAGFDPREVTEGAGLANMRDRIEALGGTVSVHSSRGHGAEVTARVPLERAGPEDARAVAQAAPVGAG